VIAKNRPILGDRSIDSSTPTTRVHHHGDGPGLEIEPQIAPDPKRPIQSADRSPATWVAPTTSAMTAAGQMKQLPQRGIGNEAPSRSAALGRWLPASGRVGTGTKDEKYGGGCAATCRMSFLRHQRSIVRWGHLHRGRSVSLLRPRLLTVSMSRSRLFLDGLHSCIARLRFTSCHQNATQRSCRSSLLRRTMEQ
jgi:hypothetical protein